MSGNQVFQTLKSLGGCLIPPGVGLVQRDTQGWGRAHRLPVLVRDVGGAWGTADRAGN